MSYAARFPQIVTDRKEDQDTNIPTRLRLVNREIAGSQVKSMGSTAILKTMRLVWIRRHISSKFFGFLFSLLGQCTIDQKAVWEQDGAS